MSLFAKLINYWLSRISSLKLFNHNIARISYRVKPLLLYLNVIASEDILFESDEILYGTFSIICLTCSKDIILIVN